MRELAGSLRAAERALEETDRIVAVAEKVYEANTSIGRETLAAYAVSPLSASELRTIQTRTAGQLEQVATRDPERSAFYAARRAAVEALPVDHRPEAAGAAVDRQREQAREALRAGRWDALASLAEELGGGRGDGEEGCACGPLPRNRGARTA